MSNANAETLVCVTGASGYIGTHAVRELLERGYRVRGTVRDPSDTNKTAHLRALPGADERLELCRGDLDVAGSFDDAIAGCQWVCHVASPVSLKAKDPQREIVDPAVNGTKDILAAIERAGSVDRVSVTSSVAAIANIHEQPGRAYTEDDWCSDATVETAPYPLSKTLAEKEMWKHHDSLPEAQRWSLTVINPVFVIGPVLAGVHVRSSPSIVKDLLTGTFPGNPPLAFALVDVRDVVDALVNGMEMQATGRYILHTKSLWMIEMARIVADAFPHIRVSRRKLPGFVMYGAALFDRRVSFGWVRRNLGRMEQFDNAKVQRELGVALRPVAQSLVDTATTMIEGGWVEPKLR